MWNAISLVQVWTRVAVPISYDDNHYTEAPPYYTTGTSYVYGTKQHPVVRHQFWSSGSMFYCFIVIISRSTLTGFGSTYQGPVYRFAQSDVAAEYTDYTSAEG